MKLVCSVNASSVDFYQFLREISQQEVILSFDGKQLRELEQQKSSHNFNIVVVD